MSEQASCVASSGRKRSVYKAGAVRAGLSPGHANKVAFTMVSLECGGKSPEVAFETMRQRHAGKPWLPPSLTLDALTSESDSEPDVPAGFEDEPDDEESEE